MRIGITCHPDYATGRLTLAEAYVRAVAACGGLPLVLPHPAGDWFVEEYFGLLDGLLLSGGVDVAPRYFGEPPRGTRQITPERDEFELALTRRFLETDKPILAVCRGVQVLNLAGGGDIYQDIEIQVPGAIDHMQQAPKACPTHSIAIEPGSRLARICAAGEIWVNSFHHQAARHLAPGFFASAKSVDGLIEALESMGDEFVLGVQWHPEQMFETDSAARKVFVAFVAAAGVKIRR